MLFTPALRRLLVAAALTGALGAATPANARAEGQGSAKAKAHGALLKAHAAHAFGRRIG
jgi:hypothetical protein